MVFGDIGTSPLYTFQECIGLPLGAEPTPENIWGVLSLIFWALVCIVALKYVTLLMRADNDGEGGIMALLALVPKEQRQVVSGRIGRVSLMVIAGAALLFGDGVITPAISVLSATEGLKSVDPSLGELVVPLTTAILAGLFAMQKRGTGALGALFGPVMVVWFVTIGVLGLRSILHHPHILAGLSPHYAFQFLYSGGFHAFTILGSVVLAITGGEALYADMGHFGRGPIRVSWFGLVMPSLVLCYFGQGALILRDPEGVQVPFFALVSSDGARMALVVLATLATIIASQGLISAVFSLSHQAIRLGFLPRMKVLHTSKDMAGQIYLPFVNWSLAVACIGLVLFFQKSEALAAAFGLAVSGTMILTSLIFDQVLIHRWGWSKGKAFLLVGLLLCIELPFFLATLLKFFHGGYIPLFIGAVLFLMMGIWCRGRSHLRDHYSRQLPSIETLPQRIQDLDARRVPGVGVYLTADPTRLPKVMESQLSHLRSVFETIVLLSVTTVPVPYVEEADRAVAEHILEGTVHRLQLRYGFMEVPDVPASLESFRQAHNLSQAPVVTYLLGKDSFITTNFGHMPAWQESIFAFLARNSLDATSDFRLPIDQVLEINNRLDL